MKAFEERGCAILDRVPRHGAVAEIGVLTGQLSAYLLRRRPDIRIVMVDNWAPGDDQPEAYKATRDVHANHDRARVELHETEARARVRRFGDRVQIIKARSTEAAGRITAGLLDVVFIDADHSYEGCLTDIVTWQPLVKAGGYIGGHDYHNPDPAFCFGVDQAVDDWAVKMGKKITVDRNFTWWAEL